MATTLPNPDTDTDGFCPKTKTYHSLRPTITLPPTSLPHYILSRHSPTTTTSSLLSSTFPSYPLTTLRHLIQTLSYNLHHIHHVTKNDVALILSPNSTHIPLLYLSLLSLGAVVAPSNPASSYTELSRQIHLTKPVIAFLTTTVTSSRDLPAFLKGTIFLDSPEFECLLKHTPCIHDFVGPEMFLDDTAAILYSSGTTGRLKGVELTHGNFIAAIEGVKAVRGVRVGSPTVTLCAVPFFHVYGFVLCLREVALGGSLAVVDPGKGLEGVLEGVERFKVTHLAVAPPLVVGMIKMGSGVRERYDLGSLEVVACGGAPLASSVIGRFKQRFPNISLVQVSGMHYLYFRSSPVIRIRTITLRLA